jgi:riboflavin synthase alpha subunit
MFTGIIQEIGRVRKMGRKGGFLVLETAYDEDRGVLRNGDSMAFN